MVSNVLNFFGNLNLDVLMKKNINFSIFGNSGEICVCFRTDAGGHRGDRQNRLREIKKYS